MGFSNMKIRFYVLLCLTMVCGAMLSKPIQAEIVEAVGGTERVLRENEEEDYLEIRDKGYNQGLSDGAENFPKPNRNDISVPDGISYGNRSDYLDGYEEGWREGHKIWTKQHPFLATLNWLWDIVSEWFTWFE
ncbi:hypothetical protein [Streptococcus pyogenes]|uniref:hypothetical protein n=3 Tax=Streptococcus pyogenes TaxID=1314 RepID=UPI00109C3E13|nr:hypothetical protein [Streptococcus pyogenes]QCK52020.1 hypothetical protein ETT57_01955 [Streptococcus pyogenes]VGW27367.1 Uncharacterised protein [Streptococcus pyogenes]VGW27747.1 Uncharacterised protein [Streptococcus pyogenes]VGW40071.1 Uncharacterised protein [Streptococcus pyogenes]VGW53453.1 Uncharacterised protein [Streptococcus pyogenes]